MKQRNALLTSVLLSAVMAVLLLSVSCVHHSPFRDSYYYDALGDPGEVVFTLDARRSAGVFDLADSPALQPFLAFLDRIDRVSLSLYRTADETEGRYSFYGGVEGNIPSFLTNTLFLYDDGFEKIEEGKVRYYRNNTLGLDVYSPRSGLLLFASDEYMKAYRQTYKEREQKIPEALAQRMGNALFGFHGEGSQNLIDIGLEVPESVLAKTRSMTVVFDTDEEGRLVLGAVFHMEADSLAKSLSILLKTKYISDKRRNGEKLGDLTGLFELEGSYVYINGMELSEKQSESILSVFSQVISQHDGGTSHAIL